MSWNVAIQTLRTLGVVEYGAFQREVQPGTPLWRRPTRGKRFPTVEDALFNEQGALKALMGAAPYPKQRYSIAGQLFMPYVAAWLRGGEFAFLARQATPEPELTVVPFSHVDALPFEDHESLTNHLAVVFGDAARLHGVRFLATGRTILQR